MRKHSAFTLTEVLTAIVIIAVLAGLAVPNFRSTIEQARSSEATTNLNVIRMGQRIFRLNNGRFWPVPDGRSNDIAAINAALNIELDTEFYNDITVTSTGGGTGFIATARRGNPGDRRYTINQDGVINEAGQF